MIILYHSGLPCFDVISDSSVYAIAFGDEQADKAAKESILDRLWFIDLDLLVEQTGLPASQFQELQAKEESGNDAILELIKTYGDVDKFVKAAIWGDSRGFYLSPYNQLERDLAKMGDEFISEIFNLLRIGDLKWDEFSENLDLPGFKEIIRTNKVYLYRIN